MVSQLRRIFTFFCLVITFFLVLFVINQTAQIVTLAQALHPDLGRYVLFLLLAIYTGIIFSIVHVFFSKPEVIHPPKDRKSSEYDIYRKKMTERLISNPLLIDSGIDFADADAVDRALLNLDEQSTQMISANATTVFFATAVSQNGLFDALTVLVMQAGMIWKIAHVYNQRPNLSEMLRLYNNVLMSAFFSQQLEEINISEQLEPVIASATASIAGDVPIPGLRMTGSILAKSILDGTANAFLTLRVGIICQQYCNPAVTGSRGKIRKSAAAKAALLLGDIVYSGSKTITKQVLTAVSRKTSEKVKLSADKIKTSADRISGAIKKAYGKIAGNESRKKQDTFSS